MKPVITLIMVLFCHYCYATISQHLKHSTIYQAMSADEKRISECLWRSMKWYKQFTPSESVDLIWHKHLMNYTDYELLCYNIIGNIVHHVPREEGNYTTGILIGCGSYVDPNAKSGNCNGERDPKESDYHKSIVRRAAQDGIINYSIPRDRHEWDDPSPIFSIAKLYTRQSFKIRHNQVNTKYLLCVKGDESCITQLTSMYNDLDLLQQGKVCMGAYLANEMLQTNNLNFMFTPYECLEPFRRSPYVNYDGGYMTEQNYSTVDGFNDCGWAYRVALYQTQLSCMRLLNENDPNGFSRYSQSVLVNYTSDLWTHLVSCYNPIQYQPWIWQNNILKYNNYTDEIEETNWRQVISSKKTTLLQCINQETYHQQILRDEDNMKFQNEVTIIISSTLACVLLLMILIMCMLHRRQIITHKDVHITHDNTINEIRETTKFLSG